MSETPYLDGAANTIADLTWTAESLTDEDLAVSYAVPQLTITAQVAVALSNLAVAEAVHLLTAAIKVRPVEITTTGSLTLDPEKVAAALQASIDKLRQEGP